MTAGSPGTLWVVATPIGNLSDISSRAVEVLGRVAVVAAEDTRHTAQLLSHCGVRASLLSCHDHNEAEQAVALIARLLAGDDVALVSDAGTPLVSDPGFRLVLRAHQNSIPVRTIPGPCAAIAALSVAGIATDRFAFEGFLPQKSAARISALAALAGETRTLVFYESRHRIDEMLADAARVLGPGRLATLARELTKVHETVLRLPLGELATTVATDAEQRLGECVVVIEGATVAADAPLQEGERVMRLLLREMTASRAARMAAEITGASRRALYALIPDSGEK